MKKVLITVFLIIICFSDAVIALKANKIIAYPVPFNPKKVKLLKIGIGTDPGPTPGRVKLEIFDINGDKVYKRNYSSMPVTWNGHNDKGSLVMPGLYIIKVDMELSTGEQGKKILRILINY